MASTLQIALQNETTSNVVYAYITGSAIQRNNSLFLLQSDGHTAYYPTSPPAVGSGLGQNCAISLGAPGSTTTVTIPQIAGGRIWFAIGTPLTFLLNPGPALVEPSVSNPADPNINISWGFCELTFNSDQLYANISYVDFVGLPIALTLLNNSGATQHVTGIPANGLATIASDLQAQGASDGQGWGSLVVKNSAGQPLRALSPNTGIVGNASLFAGYYEPYVAQVYSRYSSAPLSVDTQASFGVVKGQVSNNILNLGGSNFTAPSTANIFSCSSGPFATGSNAETNAIIPRLAAAFNRSTLMATNILPAPVADYYKVSPTNHYSRIVHAANIDGLGYAFPYDDVTADGAANQSGSVFDPNPKLFTVAVGGGNASATSRAAHRPQAAVGGARGQTQPPAAAHHPPADAQQPHAAAPKQSFLQRMKSRFGSGSK